MKTGRDFKIFCDDIPCRDEKMSLVESNLALEGAHVWLAFRAKEKRGNSSDYFQTQINVPSAKKLIAALQEFVKAAEADELTEPAEEN